MCVSICVCLFMLWNPTAVLHNAGVRRLVAGLVFPVVSDGTHNVTTSSCEGVSLLMRCPLDLYMRERMCVYVCAFVC